MRPRSLRQSVLIQTTEHLLSALIGVGVDNVIVEVDNLEVPILDGSSLPYVQAFETTGLKVQRRRREYLKILKDVEVREGSKFIGVYPGTGYSIRLHHRLSRAHQAPPTSAATSQPATMLAPSRRPAPSASRKMKPCCATWASSAARRTSAPSSSRGRVYKTGPPPLLG